MYNSYRCINDVFAQKFSIRFTTTLLDFEKSCLVSLVPCVYFAPNCYSIKINQFENLYSKS